MCVGLEVTEEYDVIIVVEGVCERHCIQEDSLRLCILIDVVRDVAFIVFVIWLYI